MRHRLPLLVAALALAVSCHGTSQAQPARPKKIVFLPGPLDAGHPRGTHEYEKTARLLKQCLDESPLAKELRTELHPGGWPDDPKVLDDADTIVLISSGADRRAEDHPILVGDRLQVLDEQMKRGCGLVAIHWTLFVPEKKGAGQFLDWVGGYFDYERGKPQGGRAWYSKIQTLKTAALPATLRHPAARGLKPFEVREEFYYNLRFRPADPRFTPILNVRIPGEQDLQTVAFAVQRKDGGRGFGFSGGHFFDNWKLDEYRRMALNAVAWTAGLDVPDGGVPSKFPAGADEAKAAPVNALIVTGHNHPAHDWRATTKALQESLGADARFRVRVTEDPGLLATKELHGFDVVVMNYCNWERPGLPDAAKKNLLAFLDKGGGLSIVHFANGAFHFSLPKAGDSDWPEWRTRLCRRVWDHTPGKSGHDKPGKFRVEIKNAFHPVTQGLASFDTVDELYFRQQGDEPVTILATARSQVTGQDEPMAFVYNHGKARVFQTVLGHDATALRTAGTAELIRRGTAWAAGQAPVGPVATAASDSPVVAGKFGGALDARRRFAEAAGRAEYRKPPLTVECWAKLGRKDRFNVIVANGPKTSADHWEIYSYVGSGAFGAYLPGYTPDEIKSTRDITDGKWHYLAMTFDGGGVKLFVDGELVKDEVVKRVREGGPDGPLWFGGYPPVNIGCDGPVDDVRVTRGIRKIDGVPSGPLTAGADTVGLWSFDKLEGEAFADASKLANPARPGPAAPAPAPTRAGPSSTTELDYKPADPRLKAVLIDRTPTDSYVSVKADTEGRLFVTAREGLFVFEPRPGGKYTKKELFRFPPDSWVSGVELRGNDLYVLTASALYVFPDGRVKHDNLRPRRLVWGLPLDLHVSFHCLAWGPEGDLYLNHGDPLLTHGDFARPDHWGHWTLFTQPDGARVPYTGVGAVLRVRPDGSDLRVVAGGLRGCFGMAFDRHFNLFTNDNDHESIPDRYTPGRLLHVTPHVDFAWPRGWVASKSPDRADLVEPMLSTPGRGVPVGLAYYDDDHLPAEYRHTLLQDRWERLAIYRYPLESRGASFAAKELPFLDGKVHARPIGVAVGRGGRVFATISYMAGNEGSPRYTSDLVMITRADDPADAPFEPYDVTTANSGKLWQELSHPSWDRRQHAHVELLRRGGDLPREATKKLAAATGPASTHLVWLAAAGGTAEASKLLQAVAADTERPALRLQALRALATFPALKAPDTVFVQALRSEEAPLRLAALEPFFDEQRALPTDDVVRLARSGDTYLRQTAARLLARRATPSQLGRLALLKHGTDALTRLAAVLAAGFRLTTPPLDQPPPPQVPLGYREPSAYFSVAIRYGDVPDKPVDLRSLGRVGSYTMADYWKTVPHSGEQKELFALLMECLRDPAEQVRLQAAYWLSLLRDPRSEAAIAKVAAGVQQKRLAAAPRKDARRVWLIGPFPNDAKKPHPPELGPIDLSASYGKLTWREHDVTGPGPDGGGTYYAYFQVQSVARQPAQFLGGPATKLWHNGSAVWESKTPGNDSADVVLDLQPGGNDILLRAPAGNSGLRLSTRARQPIAIVLPDRPTIASLTQRLKEGGKEKVAPEFLAVDWQSEARKGDAANGRKLYGSLGCVKCHAITPDQKGGGGPSLAEAGKRFTVPHLVESVLLPSKQVAELFRGTQIVTTSGAVLSGLVVAETADALELLRPDTTRLVVPKVEIDERAVAAVSPMPAGVVRSPAELRDLLAYLLSDNPLPP